MIKKCILLSIVMFCHAANLTAAMDYYPQKPVKTKKVKQQKVRTKKAKKVTSSKKKRIICGDKKNCLNNKKCRCYCAGICDWRDKKDDDQPVWVENDPYGIRCYCKQWDLDNFEPRGCAALADEHNLEAMGR